MCFDLFDFVRVYIICFDVDVVCLFCFVSLLQAVRFVCCLYSSMCSMICYMLSISVCMFLYSCTYCYHRVLCWGNLHSFLFVRFRRAPGPVVADRSLTIRQCQLYNMCIYIYIYIEREREI